MSRANLLKNIVKGAITEDKMLDRYLMSRGINPLHVTKDTKVSHSKSGDFIKWKNDHMNEAVDEKDTVTFDIPLLIRVLEFAREELKSDILLHKMVERLISIRGKGTLTMDEYGTIVKEEIENLGETYNGPRGDKLIAVSHAAYRAGDKEKSSRAHKLAMRAGEKYRSNPENNEKAIRHIMSGASKDYEGGKRWTGDSVEHPEDTNVISEISSETLQSYKDKAMKSAADLSSKGEYKKSNDRLLNHMKATGKQIEKTTASIKKSLNKESTSFEKFKKSVKKSGYDMDAGAKRLEDLLAKQKKERGEREAKENVKEDTYQDSQAATQTCYDGANNPNDTTPPEYKNKKLIQMSKSARIIKSIYKKQGVKEEVVSEEMYDHEKEDKSVKTLNKKNNDREPAAAVLKGGKTMTGTTRDTVEIDPAMRLRPGQPDPTKATPQKR